MKILQVIPFFSPEFGGSVTSTFLTCQKLSERGHKVTILTTDFHFNSSYAQKLKNVEVIPIECLTHIGLFFYSPKIKAWLSENLSGYDIIHMQNYRSYQNAIVSTCAKKLNIPYIIQAHGSVLPFFEKQGLKKIYDVVWGKSILKSASRFIAVSQTEKKQYLKMEISEKKIEIIPNGFDVSEYETLPERGIFRKEYGITSDEKIVLYLGRLHKSKGLEFLIDSFSYLLNHPIAIKLVIAGPDEGILSNLKQQIQTKQIQDKIIFTGPLYKNKKIEAFVDADVLVYPGIIEIFGLVPFEAIMCGTPVIVCNDCGCGELIAEAGCGYLVHYGDVAGLSETVKYALEHPEVNKRMVDVGWRFIEEHLAWENVVKRVEEMYESCICHV